MFNEQFLSFLFLISTLQMFLHGGYRLKKGGKNYTDLVNVTSPSLSPIIYNCFVKGKSAG